MTLPIDEICRKYSRQATVTRLIEEQAARTPERVAVASDDAQLTYGELDRRANQLAHRLQDLGARPGTFVAIAVDRSVDMVVGLLGILKAGAAYVPLDPSHPPQRLAFQLADCGAPILVTQRSKMDPFADFAGDRVPIDAAGQVSATYPSDNPGTTASPADPVYVIYTSGSTGQPKGVVVPHRALINLLVAMRDTFQLSGNDVFLGITTIAFDIAGVDIWLPLITGARVYLASRDTVADGKKLAAALTRSRATFMQATPSQWQFFLDSGWPGQEDLNIISTGEALSPTLAGQLIGRGRALWNLYGPTETTVWSTGCRLESAEAPISIGRPIANTQVYVLDSDQRPVSRGDPGELYIGGDGLAIGYLNRPQLTAERFVLNPFSQKAARSTGARLQRPQASALPADSATDSDGGLSRLYRTGDLVRLLDDGSLQCLGRADRQVKIRGVRIELGEIETVLVQHPAIRQAAVEVHKTGHRDKTLVAFVAAHNGSDCEPHVLQAFLRERLPDSMVPALFRRIDRLPLTPSGKVDHKALSTVELSHVQSESSGPRPSTPTERALADIWSELLDVERPGREDHFFDLGGHSLRAMMLAYRIDAVLGVEVHLHEIFASPTLAEMAALVDARGAESGDRSCPLVAHDPSSPAPLSLDQERLWVIDRMGPGSPQYNESVAMRLMGEVDEAALERALQTVVDRHAALRSRFTLRDGRPVQVAVPASACRVPLQRLVLEVDDPANEAQRLADLLAERASRPFDLETAPLVRAALIRIATPRTDASSLEPPSLESPAPELASADAAPQWTSGPETRQTRPVPAGKADCVLLLTLHHIICDEWSIDIVLREMSAAYAAALRLQPCRLPEPAFQFGDYARWHRDCAAGGDADRDAAYWKRQLAGAAASAKLPTDRIPSAAEPGRAAVYRFSIPGDLADALRELSRQQGVTLFMTMLALFRLVLWRWSGEEDAVVGTPIANRALAETHGMVGFFLNMLAIRIRLNSKWTLRELLDQAGQVVGDAYRHGTYPFAKLVELLDCDRCVGRTPLLEHVFVYHHEAAPLLELPGVPAESIDIEPGAAKFDMTFSLRESQDGFSAAIEYRTDLFDRGTIERFAEHFVRMAASAVADPDQSIGRMEIVTPDERKQLFVGFNSTEKPYSRDASIHAVFEEQARRRPKATALVCGDERVSYEMLDRRADRLAYRLRARGAGRGERIGICAERSIGFVVGILGILKAGGAYVPLDPQDPDARLKSIIGDTGISIVVTGSEQRKRLAGLDVAVLAIDDAECDEGAGASGAAVASSAEDIAYVMHTSGSSGQPKGVEIPHRGVVRLVCSADYVPLDAEQTFLLLAPTTFDASTFEIWGPLLNGARLVIFPDRRIDPRRLKETIEREGVTCLWLTAALFNAIIDEDPGTLAPRRTWHKISHKASNGRDIQRSEGGLGQPLKYLLTGGEALSVRHVRRALDALPHTQIINGYGPTESTTFACTYSIPRDFPADAPSVPIGRPIANTRVYILDEAMRPVPIGVPGELYIGGDGLARGYAGRPDLTAERFVADPFSDDPDARLYRTGDRCRYLAGGDIEFLGRLDRQVKIRGFRIEPGEIESVLRRHAAVRQAIVETRETERGGRRLVALVVPHDADKFEPREVRKFLRQHLPDYMVPDQMQPIDRVPLTANGKVDHAALRMMAMDRSDVRRGDAPPETAAERALAAIWAELLSVKRLDRDDDFFQLGGDSLLAMKLVARIEQRMGTALSMAAVFRSPTLAQLAGEIDAPAARAGERVDVLVPLGETRRAPALVLFDVPFRWMERCHFDGAVYGAAFSDLTARLGGSHSVEWIGRQVAEEITRKHPHGPLVVGGFSLGGLIAYEAARCLAENGYRASLLVLFDAYVPSICRRRTRPQRVLARLRNLPRTGLRDILRPVHRRLDRKWVERDAIAVRAWEAYRPGEYRGRILLIRAIVPPPGFDIVADPDHCGWKTCTRGTIETVTVPGGHHDLFIEPNAGVVLQALRDALERHVG